MNIIDGDKLFILVRDMRKLQKEYFRTRATDLLPLCKQLEKNVDNFIKKLETTPRQGSLI